MIPQRWIEAYLRFLLRYRGVVTIVVALLTAFFAYSLKDIRLQTDFRDFLPPRHPYIQFYDQFQRSVGSANVLSVILEVKHGDIYNPDTLKKLDRITKFMIYSKGVVSYQIYSIAHPVLRSVVASDGAVNLREIFWLGLPKTQEDADRIRFSVYATPAIRRVFTASDDTAAVVHAAFWDEGLDYRSLSDRMMELKRTEEDANHRIHITGLPWLYTSVLQYAREVYVVFGCTILSLSFLLYAYFRFWIGVWVPLFSAALSSVWGLAITVLFGFNLDPLVLVIPIFLTARALSHSVQSMDRYHEEFYRRGDKHQAIIASYARLFAPAIASIVTDGLAMLVVAVAPIPMVQKVAIFASFWIVSIFVSVVTLHPIILSYVDPPPARDIEADRGGRLTIGRATALSAAAAAVGVALASSRVLPGLWAFLISAPVIGWYWYTYSGKIYPALTRFVIRCTAGRRRWAVVLFSAGLYVVLPLWGWTLKVGDMTPGAALLFADHPYNIAFDLLNGKFLGASQLIVMADTMKPDGLKGDGVMQTLLEFGDHMESAPGARATFSVAEAMKEMGRMLRDGDPKWGIIPERLHERAELLLAFELMSSAGDLNQYVDRGGRYAAVVTLFNQHSHDIVQNAIAWAKQFRPTSDTVQFRFAGGLFGILAAINETVEATYWLNLGLILGIVALCLYLTYGSLTATAILMVPVILAQLAAEALMVVMHIDLNVNSLPVMAAGAGAGVDYGIYHFSRMLDAYDEIGDLDVAVDHATATTGKAIIFTASSMVAATIFWWFSNLKFQAEMGLLLALLMIFNTVGGLIVVPAFVKVLRPRVVLGRRPGASLRVPARG